ncbi:MAG: beta-Ala-His dipeptidase, partial [Muribaculaceae bacterium]|nr:beta-Ala-His dipeptidase [Muribaculaceae bacterium]
GMGCAAAMAVLLDDSLVHGPIECLYTVDEEQGLIGANGLQPGFVTGEILLNLDSEEMGQLVIGCAGGKVTVATIPYNRVSAPEGLIYYRISLGGLKGGHSGMEIGLGRANANQQLARFLCTLAEQAAFEVAEIDGGGLANAIPRDAHAVIGLSARDIEKLQKLADEFNQTIHAEYAGIEEDNFHFNVEQADVREEVIDMRTAHNLIKAVYACPNGVQGMSHAIEGLIETSCNLASVKMTDGDKIEVTVHQRSSVDSRRDEIADRVKALFSLIGATVAFDDAYVGWAPNPNSKVLKVAEESYRDIFHAEPKVEALHAGLECGLFLEKMPALDMVSFGPTLKDIHSPGEKANIKSVEDFWKLLTEILRRLA